MGPETKIDCAGEDPGSAVYGCYDVLGPWKYFHQAEASWTTHPCKPDTDSHPCQCV
jgi:hypothetical protein